MLTDIYAKVTAGRYNEAKPRIDLLATVNNASLQRLCASMYFLGGDIKEAIELFEKSDTINCDNVDALIMLGNCYQVARMAKETASCYEKVLTLDHDNATARMKLANIDKVLRPPKDDKSNIEMHRLFQQLGFNGFFKLAAKDYQEKGKIGGVPLETMQGSIPLWRGEKVNRLLIVGDQGNGDVLQFMRYVKLARQLCNHLTVAVYPYLMSLIALNPDIDNVINADIIHTAELADAYTVSFILPHLVNAGYEPEPYIHVEADKLSGFHVGVCWRGNNINHTDYFRSASYEVLKAFEGFTDITFHSLQVGAESDKAPSWMVRHTLDNYEATARVIASLDLVITVDTSVAHLAGAMGKPVWIGLGNPSCWRWENGETSTKWYNTARLFRNKTDWQETFNLMAAELKKLRTGI